MQVVFVVNAVPRTLSVATFRNRDEVVSHQPGLVVVTLKLSCEKHVVRLLKRNIKTISICAKRIAQQLVVSWETPLDICNRKDYVAHDWHRIVNLVLFIQRCCAHRFLLSTNFVSVPLKKFYRWVCDLFFKQLRKKQRIMKTEKVMLFTVFKHLSFSRLKSFDWKTKIM